MFPYLFIGLPLLVILSLCLLVIGISSRAARTAAREPRWEAVQDLGGSIWRVRWSQTLPGGYYLYVRHYSGRIAQIHAEATADRFNDEGRRPEEWDSFRRNCLNG